MRRFAMVMLASVVLAGCGDTWMGENEPPPLPGKRVSVLGLERTLKPDNQTSGKEILLPEPDDTPAWPQAGGYSPHAMHHLVLGDNPKKLWSADIGEGSSKRLRLLSRPVVADGKVFAMDAEAEVSAYDAATGSRLWNVDVTPEEDDQGNIGGGLAYDEGRLFVTTGFAQVIALDPKSGKQLWRQTVSAPIRGAPTARGGRVIGITVENQTVALAADDGRQLWTHQGLAETASIMGGSSPAIDANVVVSAYSSGELFALRIENGSVLWAESLATARRTDQAAALTDIRGLPVIDRGRVYAVGNSDTMAAIDLRTGRRLWDREIGSLQTPWIVGDYIYVLTNTPELVALDAKTGRIHWVTPLQQWEDEEDKKGRVVWSGPLVASDRVIVTSSHGWAMAISPYSGEPLGRLRLSDGVAVPPIVANQTLFVLTQDADLVAYR